MTDVCAHGQLRTSCAICDLTEAIRQARRERDAAIERAQRLADRREELEVMLTAVEAVSSDQRTRISWLERVLSAANKDRRFAWQELQRENKVAVAERIARRDAEAGLAEAEVELVITRRERDRLAERLGELDRWAETAETDRDRLREQLDELGKEEDS